MGFFKKGSSLKVMERTSADSHIEEQINKAGIEKYAESEFGDLYIRTDELGGFLIMESLIVSATNFKSKKGSKLIFTNENESLTFESDEDKIESDFSELSNRHVTKIDYNIEAEEVQTIEDRPHDHVRFEINGKEIIFSIIK